MFIYIYSCLNSLSLYLPKDDNTKYILELPENSIIRKNIKINTKVKLVKVNGLRRNTP